MRALSEIRFAEIESASLFGNGFTEFIYFCRHCGCSLFFDPPGRDWIGIAMGAFDGPTGTHTELHVFVSEKGDYYEICDGLPQFATVPGTD